MFKMKKLAAVAAAAIMAVSTMSVSASAAETSDSNFSISIFSVSALSSNTASRRQKTDSSSTYVNYITQVDGTTASGPYKFRAVIFGSNGVSGVLKDCSSYTSSGTERPAAIVTKGTKGYIKQLVFEEFKSNAYAQIYGAASSSQYTGTAKGKWSPDSVADPDAVNYN